jgi:secondary thiamine-phosphate synthase enzyme
MVKTHRLPLSTRGNADVIDITDEILEALDASKLKDGILTLFCPGSTGGLTTIEYEDGAVADLQACFDRLVPRDATYHHEKTWHDGNGHAHVRSSLLGPSLTVPFSNGKLTLGTWQQIVFVDFDNRPRKREIVLQFIGE